MKKITIKALMAISVCAIIVLCCQFVLSDEMDAYCFDQCVGSLEDEIVGATWLGNDPILEFTRCQCFYNENSSSYIQAKLQSPKE